MENLQSKEEGQKQYGRLCLHIREKDFGQEKVHIESKRRNLRNPQKRCLKLGQVETS